MIKEFNLLKNIKLYINIKTMQKRLTHDKFIETLPKDIKYDIIGKYIGAHDKILIEDKYGQYLIMPGSLKKMTTPTIISALNKQQYCINKFLEVHQDLYDYSKFIYKGEAIKSIIICKVHGNFEQSYHCHVRGMGCFKCARHNNSIHNTHSTELFIKKANIKHNMKYNYSLTSYIHSRKSVDIICPIHNKFSQLACNHLQGRGCPTCCFEIIGWGKDKFIKSSQNKECIFYIINCYNNDENFYKIGLTNRNVKTRYKGKKVMPYKYKIIKEIKSTDPEYIWDIENKLKRLLKEFKYNPIIYFPGASTECFTNVNILEKVLKQTI